MNDMQGTPIHLQPTMPNSILPGAQHKTKTKTGPSFYDTLNNSIKEINEMQHNANEQMEKLARGEIKDVHQVMIAAQEANLTFSTMMQIRNKIVEAYKEISKM